MLSIKTHPDPCLRKKSKRLTLDEIHKESAKQLVGDMVEIMKQEKGLGLAAPQVGVNKRLFLVATDKGSAAFINPKISRRSFSKATEEEGCLSIPDVYGLVKRPKKITVSFYSIDGKKQKIVAKGLLAQVIQHETDHLDGILFIDKAKKITKGSDLLKEYES